MKHNSVSWKNGVRLIFFSLAVSFAIGCNHSGNGAGASPSLVSIAVTPSNASVTAGNTRQLAAAGTYSDGTTRDITTSVTWTSSDNSIATIESSGLVTAVAAGSTTIIAASGAISEHITVTVNPFALSPVKTVALTTDAEGGSARPEIIAGANRVFVVYLGDIGAHSGRSFKAKIFDSDLVTRIASTTLVTANAAYGGPTDIRIASDGQALFAFYETYSDSTGSSYLWGAKYTLNDNFERTAATASPIAASNHIVDPPDGHELLDDPAPLIGPNSVFVITRYDYSIAKAGNTVYHVREFNRDTLVQLSEFDLDLSSIADGRGRVTSLLYWNNSIFMALATTVSDQGVIENNDDGARCDIILVKMKPDWTFDPALDVRTISAGSNDWENYITGLRTDGNYFYLSYKQAVGIPPAGEQRAMIKIFDMNFKLLHQETVKSVLWGPEGGEMRPSLEIRDNTIFSGQSAGLGLGTGNAEITLFDRN